MKEWPYLSAAVAVIGCAASTSPGPLRTTPTGASNVFVAPEPGERHLANIRQLTFGGNNAEAYFSADGKQLIFQRKASVDRNTGCDQEYVINVDGSQMHRVSDGTGRTTCGYFIDQDRQILYSSTFAFDSACPPMPDPSLGYIWPLSHFEIYAANRDGSGLKPLTRTGGYNAETTASVDGKHLIFTSTRDGDIDLYTMNSDGTNLRRVTNRIGYDGGAFFSRNGKEIVWRAAYPATAADSADYRRLLAQNLVRPAALEIWTAHADGTAPHQVTHLGGANWAPYFFPDGKRIIFTSNYQDPHGGNFDLYLIGTDGTGLEKVTTSAEFDGFPIFSPDGRKLVWISSRHAREPGEINIFIADWKD